MISGSALESQQIALMRARKGLTIVCEQHGADWLPFRLLLKNNGLAPKSFESIWVNVNYD
jgi:hypothetical protein